MKRPGFNRRGVALILVLSALMVLTAMGVEFAYNTNVNYHLASGERDRLQAYYLAKSAFNFMLLELKFDRVFRQVVQQQNLGQYLGENANLPLCQQFPLSTGLIRAVFTGGGAAALMGGEEGAEGGGEEGAGETEDEALEDMRRDASLAQESSAEEFLQFEGDFDGECIDESTKIDLNGFSGLSTTPTTEGARSPFDQYKDFLFAFLSRPQFDLLFEKADVTVTDVINNIGDWVDPNTDVNELDGRTGGAEQSIYERLEVPYPVRNGKLVTLLETYLIADVVDTWFEPMMEYFTVYGDGKVNVCTASTDVVEGLIRRYQLATPGLPPLRLEDPEEMTRLTDAIAEACASGAFGDQLKSQIVTALNTAIGAAGAETGGTEQTQQTGQTQQGGETGFGSYITTESRFFSLKLAGQVMDTTVRVKAVIDVKEQDPTKWKLLYWRVQ